MDNHEYDTMNHPWRPKEIGESNDRIQEMTLSLPDHHLEWMITTQNLPYMQDILVHEPGRVVFDGYFYIEKDTLPIEQIIRTKQGEYHVEIYEKNTLEDTTTSAYDEEVGGYVSFFSTAIIELRYRILTTIQSTEEYHAIRERIQQLEKEVILRDRANRFAREQRERHL